jgi:hypothetical protein
LVIFRSDDLSSRQVDELHVALGINHKVLRLYVATHDLVVVKKLQQRNNTTSVELAVLSRQQSDRTHYLVKILPTNILLKVEE